MKVFLKYYFNGGYQGGRILKKYPRLDKYYDELIKMEDEEPERFYDQHSYSLMCTLECISNYEFIKDFCLKNNFKSVFDIGCCFGYQSEVFYESGIQYRGLDDTISKYLWNSELYEYQVGRFPCDVKSRKGELGISVLCLGWNCYLYEGAKTLDEQFESLVNQFEYSLIYMQQNLVPLISRHFSKVEHLEDNFYFFKR